MISLIILAIIFIATLAFLYFTLDRMDRNNTIKQKELIRELSRTLKSKDITEYIESEPNEEPLIQEEQDEFVDLDQIEPNKLLNSLME